VWNIKYTPSATAISCLNLTSTGEELCCSFKKLHKSQSAPNFLELPKPSPPQNERKHLSVKPYPSEFTNFPDNMKVMPVYTLWSTDDNKSNITPESSSRQSLKPEMDEGSLQKVAEYILNEQHSSSSVDVRFRQEIAVADGVDLMLFHSLIIKLIFIKLFRTI
jgi:hypothetical protein